MNSPFHLFLKRIKNNIVLQYKIISIVIDRVVALYLLVPPIIVGGLYYRDVWLTEPSYLFSVSPFTLSLLLFLLIIPSVFYSFYEYGDQLFLVQNRSWYHKIKQYGLGYTFLIHLFTSMGCFLILLPILFIGLSYSWLHTAILCLYTSFYMTTTSILKRRLSLIRRAWKRLILYCLCLVIGFCCFSALVILESTYAIVAGCILLLFLLSLLFFNRQSSYSTYFVDLATYDIKVRYKYLKWILTTGEYKIPQVKNHIVVPLMFKKSNQLFKDREASNVLVESHIKQFLRNKDYVVNYFYFTAASVYPLFLLPLSGKMFYTIVFAFIYLIVGKKVWQVFMFADFMKLYKWSDATVVLASRRASTWFALPAFTILTIVSLATSHTSGETSVCALISVIGFLIIIGFSSWRKR